MMYSMKEACVQTDMSYETLKFYCKEGLVPNVKRDSHNYRVFDDRDIKWIQSLGCLKRCGMTLAEMKEYLAYCLEGPSSIPERKEILAVKKKRCSHRWKNCRKPSIISTGNRIFTMMSCREKSNITAI